jgi:type I restriction enzyme S subunit
MSSPWKSVRLGDYCSKIGSGSTPRGGDTVYQESGVSFIRSQNVYNGQFVVDGLAFLNDEQAERLKGVTVLENDILLNITGDSVARCCQVPELIIPARVNQHVAIIRPNNNSFDSRFVSYFFISPFMQSTMLSYAGSGGTRKAITKEMIENFEIPKPPIQIQKQIASILSTYDDLIENNRRRMALLEDAARQVYQEWFVRLRFPGYEHTCIVDGVPEGWEKKTALDAIQVLSGGTPKTTNPDYWDGEIPFYTPKDAEDGIWVTECERTVTELGLKNCNSKLYPKKTVFISARGTVGKLNMAQRPMVMSQSCYALVGKDHLTQTFVYSAMQVAVESLRQQAVGAVFDAIIVDTFNRITLLVPDNKIVRLFDETIRPMFEQVENLTIQNQKLRTARDLLLPKLMSGEIAV